ncbi:MAG: DUF2157 domain-containing protein [Proteobacteria bacterium]|nr:DUF2157 domain-containing protein [Pseudomonadota bacterium]MBU1710883.1 DUF2157 domain-containing protein [Pseudomonadota bacterium]
MIKHIRWLANEVEQWCAAGIITREQAAAIKGRYPDDQPAQWGRIIFFSLGAILFGLGVILLFAYNWHALHKFVKLGVVFLAILAAHGSGFALCRPQSNNQALGEGLHVLGTVLFGAGIWLIAQIYHINEYYPNGILFWSLGALALAWALPSTPQGVAAAFLVALWGGCEVWGFHQINHPAPLIIIVGLLPLAWLQKSRVLLGAAISSILVTVAFNSGRMDEDLLVTVFIFLANALIAAALLAGRSRSFPESRRILSFFGNLVYIIVLYALTFKGVSRHLAFDLDSLAAILYLTISGFLAVSCWLMTALKAVRQSADIRQILQPEHIGQIISMVLVLALGFADHGGGWGWGGASIFNLLFLFHCVMLIIHGCREVNLKQTTLGCLLFSILAISRYVDLFGSLIARSMVFFVVGGAIFATGFFYSKSKKQGLEDKR